MVCIHVCYSRKTNRIHVYMEIIQEDKEKKSPACRPGLWKGTDQMSISRCFLPSHYDTGRTWTEIKLNQVGCIKCLNLLLDWWSSLNLS